MLSKKIVFLTGTRADFGKIKSLIQILKDDASFEVHLFVTGMHLQEKYGYTVIEIVKSGFENIHRFNNETSAYTMDLTMAKTIEGFSPLVQSLQPDLIVIHGDRVEALAGATVGALNNILVAHIEGGEKSGTIDELIRHAVSKLSHIHLVSNEAAKTRLIQMGELESSIYTIGSPDVDVMFSKNLPSLEEAKSNYNIVFEEYCIGMFHPVTTEKDNMAYYAKEFVDAILKQQQENFIFIYPNNDMGNEAIFKEYERFKNATNVVIFPSLRFEYFLALLKSAKLMIGNSSAGVREAPYYGIPTINVGSRQLDRVSAASVINCGNSKKEITKAFDKVSTVKVPPLKEFGEGKSAQLFSELLKDEKIWQINHQKQFKDI
ncbi:MAG: UDP-N-acetylglucosamine 2-epimerase [Nonlabens sp.]|uniref:UDP-N-acetylglucosamine 2-epimerase n=1 Tax=Nonlabens sp. TaxID=1888209 RepID=UPI003219ABFF